MILLVGLGNPGPQYEKTRHNIGFMLIDLFLSKDTFIDISSTKFKGNLYKKDNLLLLKPNTFMNLSGLSVKQVVDFYKVKRFIVAHDDIDLKFSAIKFKKGGSSGGHNGLKSIDQNLNSEYERVRLGIGRDSNVADYVLSKFSKEQEEFIPDFLHKAFIATKELLNNDILKISQKFTSRGK